MDHLRRNWSGGVCQEKALDEYRKQAFALFSDLMDRISNEAVSTFYKLTLAILWRNRSASSGRTTDGIHPWRSSGNGKETPKSPNRPKPAAGQETIPAPAEGRKKFKKCHGHQQQIA